MTAPRDPQEVLREAACKLVVLANNVPPGYKDSYREDVLKVWDDIEALAKQLEGEGGQ